MPLVCVHVPFHNQQDRLSEIVDVYSSYSLEGDKIEFIFVDDNSDVPLVVPETKLNVRLFRIVDDRLNMPEANNIAARFARSPVLLRTDADHVFPEKTLRSILETVPIQPGQVGTFRRISGAGKDIHRHMNTIILHRSDFVRVRGYDENFSGHYGKDDNEFRARLRRFGVADKPLDLVVHVDGKGSKMNRSTAHNTALFCQRELQPPPLRHIMNFRIPFHERLHDGTIVQYPTSTLPPIYGLTIVKNDPSGVGAWLAHHVLLFEAIHVLDGSDKPGVAEFIRDECAKYPSVFYQHERDCVIEQPNDHDLRIPGHTYLRQRYRTHEEQSWICLLHMDEFMVSTLKNYVHDAIADRADYIRHKVLEILPGQDERAGAHLHRNASPTLLYQQAWSKTGALCNHFENRLFRDGPGVHYTPGTNGSVLPDGLRKMAKSHPVHAHFKVLDPIEATGYEGHRRADHFNGKLVGLPFDSAELFTERYGPHRRSGSISDVSSVRKPEVALSVPEEDERPVLVVDNPIEIPEGTRVIVPRHNVTWEIVYALKQLRKPATSRLYLCVLHGDANVDMAVAFLNDTFCLREKLSWFTLIEM